MASSTRSILLICIIGMMRLCPSQGNFATRIYKQITRQPGNFFISPDAIQYLLALARVGAGGNTAKQINEVANLPENLEDLIEKFRDLENLDFGNNSLGFGNLLVSDGTIPIDPDYQSLIEDSFGAKVVNKEGEFQPMTFVSLFNFKGSWAESARAFYEDSFHRNDYQEMKVNFFRFEQVAEYAYGEECDVDYVELPFDNQVTMLLVIPRQFGGLKCIEKSPIRNLKHLGARSTKKQVHVDSPRIDFESTNDLSIILINMGMTDMFTSEANFTGITSEPLQLLMVAQQSVLHIDGEKSSASSVVVALGHEKRSAQVQSLNVKADKPFLFALRLSNNNIFGIGRVSDPLYNDDARRSSPLQKLRKSLTDRDI